MCNASMDATHKAGPNKTTSSRALHKAPPLNATTTTTTQSPEAVLAAVKKEAKHSGPKEWHDNLDNVLVLSPDMDLQVMQQALNAMIRRTTHFGAARAAIIFKPGVYPKGFTINLGYYTSLVGVGVGPEDVVIPDLWVDNDITGHSTNNFWRSAEGMTVTNKRVMWAVSQAAPLRRVIVENDLWLSHYHGYSSGGFFADVVVGGTLQLGTQQQWLARNSWVGNGIHCVAGWSYVFMGVTGLTKQMTDACSWGLESKITDIEATPRVAEKPYLVLEGQRDWHIYVPKYIDTPTEGPTKKADREASIAYKLSFEKDVFVANPDMTAHEINHGMAAKAALFLTPGVYRLDKPLVVKKHSFVILGLGFPTLLSPYQESCIKVLDGLADVRIAGVLLDAGTPISAPKAAPLLQWGNHARKPTLARPARPGVMSDVFARIGTFRYNECRVTRADAMVEINANGVVVDNLWVWHADHDDCSDFEMGVTTADMAGWRFNSDRCHSTHGVVVNGHSVTTYGMAVEHVVNGHMVQWNGEYGQVYFYQAELPYHSKLNEEHGYAGYAVDPSVLYHFAVGLGVYIIQYESAKVAFQVSPFADLRNALTVVVWPQARFENQVCRVWEGKKHKMHCYQAETCRAITCYTPAVPRLDASSIQPALPPPVMPDFLYLPTGLVDYGLHSQKNTSKKRLRQQAHPADKLHDQETRSQHHPHQQSKDTRARYKWPPQGIRWKQPPRMSQGSIHVPKNSQHTADASKVEPTTEIRTSPTTALRTSPATTTLKPKPGDHDDASGDSSDDSKVWQYHSPKSEGEVQFHSEGSANNHLVVAAGQPGDQTYVRDDATILRRKTTMKMPVVLLGAIFFMLFFAIPLYFALRFVRARPTTGQQNGAFDNVLSSWSPPASPAREGDSVKLSRDEKGKLLNSPGSTHLRPYQQGGGGSAAAAYTKLQDFPEPAEPDSPRSQESILRFTRPPSRPASSSSSIDAIAAPSSPSSANARSAQTMRT